MAIPEEIIRDVREHTDIVEIVSEYVSLKRKGGKNYFGLCPFHQEKTPSFSVHPDRQIFHCFGCGRGGNVFTFVMEMERIEFPDAVRRLAERAGIKIAESGRSEIGKNEELYRANELALKFYRYRLTDMDGEDIRSTREYMEKRGISEEIQARFELGLSPDEWDGFLKVAGNRGFSGEVLERAGLAVRGKQGGWYDRFRGRLMFPIRNESKRVVGFGGRILKEDPEKQAPKYLNTSDTPIYHKGRILYGLPQARGMMRTTGEAILVEGYTDLIAMHRAGFEQTVATLGTALTSDQAALIKRFANRAILLYDADEAGGNAAFRGADILIGAGLEVRIALLPEGEDPDSLVESGGREALEEVLEKAESLVDFKIGYFRRSGALDTPRGQGEAARALIETLRRIPDEITRQFALHEAAEKLGVNEQVLGKAMAGIRRPGGGNLNIHGNNAQSTDSLGGTLQNLLWVLIRYPKYTAEVFAGIKSADLGDHPLRPVFELLEAALMEKRTVTEADLYDSLNNNTDIIPLLNDVLTRPEPEDPDFPLDAVRSAPLEIRRHAIKQRLPVLRENMKKGGDSNAAAEYNKLIQELRAIETKLFSSGWH